MSPSSCPQVAGVATSLTMSLPVAALTILVISVSMKPLTSHPLMSVPGQELVAQTTGHRYPGYITYYEQVPARCGIARQLENMARYNAQPLHYLETLSVTRTYFNPAILGGGRPQPSRRCAQQPPDRLGLSGNMPGQKRGNNLRDEARGGRKCSGLLPEVWTGQLGNHSGPRMVRVPAGVRTGWEHRGTLQSAVDQDRPVTENRQDEPVTENRQDEPVTENRHDEPVTENRQDEPVTENLQDGPVTENRHDEPVTENRQDEPVTENRQDGPVTENRQDEPVTENRQDEPVTENRQDGPVTENRQDEPVTENHQDGPETENRQDEPVTENRQDEPVTENRQDEPVTENRQDGPVTENRQDGRSETTNRTTLTEHTFSSPLQAFFHRFQPRQTEHHIDDDQHRSSVVNIMKIRPAEVSSNSHRPVNEGTGIDSPLDLMRQVLATR